MTLSEHTEPAALTVEFNLRNFEERQKFVIQSKDWHFHRVDLHPKKLKNKNKPGPKPEHTEDDLLDILRPESLCTLDWQEQCKCIGISRSSFYDLKKILVEDGKVYECKIDHKWEVVNGF